MEYVRITKTNLFNFGSNSKTPWQQNYLAMYSSLWHGFTTDPDLMFVPLDDHLVHRGDGVFEVMRCVDGKIYALEGHLERLRSSAAAVDLAFPDDYKNIREILAEIVRLGGEKNCVLRIIVSRGPGSFNVNPFDCPETCMYVNTMRFTGMPESFYEKGVSLVTSTIPVKDPFFANIKSCNYLPNVLMKMEAIKRGADFPVSVDENGCLAEGATENIGIVNQDGIMKMPHLEKILAGITAGSVLRLAKRLVEQGLLKDAIRADIPVDEARQAREIFLTGTSIDVLPVVTYDNHKVGDGLPGPVSSRLLKLLRDDMLYNDDLLTSVME